MTQLQNQFGLNRRILRESVSGYIGCENDIKTVNSVPTHLARSIVGLKLFFSSCPSKGSLPHERATDFPLSAKGQEKSTVSTLVMPAMICNGFLESARVPGVDG